MGYGAGPGRGFRGREDRCVSRPRPRSADHARTQSRPCDPQDIRRPTLVALLLLHAGGHQRVCEALSGGDQAGPACASQGCRLLRFRSRSGREKPLSRMVSAAATTTFARLSVQTCATTSGANTIPKILCVSMRLRLQETGMIKSDPQTIIANGTDWRFLDEMKRELKT